MRSNHPFCTSLALVLLAVAGTARAETGGAQSLLFHGHGFGTQATVGQMVVLGKSAPISLGCGSHFAENMAAGVDAPPLVIADQVHSTVEGIDTGPVRSSRTTAEVQQVSLLNGLITATEVRAVSTTSHDGTTFGVSGEGSSLVDLRVAGMPVSGSVEPNTRVDLAGFGFAVLNEQQAQVGSADALLQVTMIHLFITMENPLAVVGTDIRVASALSRLRAAAGILTGNAFGTSAQLGSAGTFGPSALVGLPCGGTGGALRENTAVGVDLSPALEVGTIRNTAQGTVTPQLAAGQTEARVETVDVADGLVTIAVVVAGAQVHADGLVTRLSSEGSSFVDLRVRGFPAISDDVPANTQLAIDGLGTLWLKRVIRNPSRITVRMVELLVAEPNDLGLEIGSRIRVGVASAGLKP